MQLQNCTGKMTCSSSRLKSVLPPFGSIIAGRSTALFVLSQLQNGQDTGNPEKTWFCSPSGLLPHQSIVHVIMGALNSLLESYSTVKILFSAY